MAQDETQNSQETPAPTKRSVPLQTGLTVNQAAKRIEAMDLSSILGADDDEEVVDDEDSDEDTPPSSRTKDKGRSKPTPKKKEEPVEDDEDDSDDEDDEQEAAEDDEEDEVADEDEESDEEDEDSDDVDEEDAESDNTPTLDLKRLPKGITVPVKVDGKTKQVSLTEALAGYSRTDSFTKKSQALADKSRQQDTAHAKRDAEVTRQAEYYVSQLAALEEALAQPEPNWAKIRSESPEQFAELHAAWTIHKDEIAKITAEREAEQKKLNEKSQVKFAETAKNERAKLVELHPQWGDSSDKGAEFRQNVFDFGLKHGFSKEELTSVVDHRAMNMLVKAALYDKLTAEKSVKDKKAKSKVDEVQKSMRSGSKKSSKRTAQRTRHDGNMARLRKTGDVRDAAKVLEGMF